MCLYGTRLVPPLYYVGYFMTKFRNKLRVETHRMPGWDYSGNGYYFVTIVTFDRQWIFGEIIKKEMRLNAFGEIAHHEWEISGKIRDEMFLREFIVMPNHIHGIVGINHQDIDGSCSSGSKTNIGLVESNGIVETHGRVSPPNHVHIPNRSPKSLSSFIAGYKSSTTSHINRILAEQGTPVYTRKNRLWQANYHDHVIRNNAEYKRIRKYIRDNPKA